MNGVVHHRRTEEEQEEISQKYKQGLVTHSLMEIGNGRSKQ